MREGGDALTQAEKLLKQGRLPEALDLLVPWVERRPDDLRAWELLAALHRQRQAWPHAEKAAGQVVRLTPNSARAWSNWGAMLRRVGRADEAANAQRKALEVQLGCERPHIELDRARSVMPEDVPAQTDQYVLFSAYRATVTPKLVSIEPGRAFAVGDITAVHVREHRVPAEEAAPAVATGTGAAMVASALGNLLSPALAWGSPEEAPEQPMALAVASCLLILVGAVPLVWGLVGLRRARRPPPVYVLTLVFPREQVEAYRSHDRHFIEALAAAIRQAMALRWAERCAPRG